MRPASRRLTNGMGGLFEAAILTCHCLLVETDHGLARRYHRASIASLLHVTGNR